MLNAWQENGQFQQKIDLTLKDLSLFDKILADQLHPSIEPAFFNSKALLPSKRPRQRPAPSRSTNTSDDQDQEKEALDNDSVAEKKRERSPLREMLKRAKKPWLIR